MIARIMWWGAIVYAGVLVALGVASGQTASESEGVRAFRDVASVLTNPRCMNCHVPGDSPMQGDDSHPHTMRVARGVDGRGTPALRCGTCHQATNAVVPHGPPGVEGWRLPPPDVRMAWHGLALPALCQTVRDPKTNGGRSPAQLLDHVSHDHLVQWAWNAGPSRAAPPLAYDQFVARFRLWVDQGAPCPSSERAAREVRR
jgi:hypothetical protein